MDFLNFSGLRILINRLIFKYQSTQVKRYLIVMVVLSAFPILFGANVNELQNIDFSVVNEIPIEYIHSYQKASYVLKKLKDENNSLDELPVSRSIPGGSNLFLSSARGVVLLISPDLNHIGAGSLIGNEGKIITSWHLVRDTKNFLVWGYDSRVSRLEQLGPAQHVNASVISVDKSRDLALLQLDGILDGMAPLSLSLNTSIWITQDIYTIGHPEQYIWSFSQGVVSQLRSDHKWSILDYDFQANIIQTQTPVSPGNSGGPVFNMSGELIGIHSHRSKDSQINFAVRVGEIRSFINENNKEFIDNPVSHSELNIDDRLVGISLEDLDENGIIDLIKIDTNQNGSFDLLIYDKNIDGFFEYYVFDENHDEKYDKIGIDTNKDGMPNKFNPYKK